MSSKQTIQISRNFLKKVATVVASGMLLSMIWGLYLTTPTASAAPEKTITISCLWSPGGINVYMQELTKLFEETHPNVKFSITTMEQEQKRAVAPRLLSSPGGPDVTEQNFGSGTVPGLVKIHAVENLDPYYEKYGWWKFLPEHLRTHQIPRNGHMYHFSVASVFTPMIFYNKVIFKEIGAGIPESLEEFYTLCDKLRSEGYEPLAMGDRNGWPGFHMYQCIATRTVPLEDYEKILYFGKEEYHEERYMADYPGFADAFRIMREMEIKKAWASGVLDMDDAGAQQLLLIRKAAMYESGGWAISTIREGLGDDVDFFLFPQIKEDIPVPLTSSYADEFLLSAFAEPEVKDMVAEFFDFTLSKEGQKIILGGGSMPIRTDFSKAELEKIADPMTVKVIQLFGSGKYPITDEIVTFWDAKLYAELSQGTQAVIAGMKTPEQMVKEMDKLAAEIRAGK